VPAPEPITLVPYDPAWPRLAAEAARLLRASRGAIDQIEHFGSTAIPGLAAKPTIDIIASVPDLAALDPFAAWLQADGYDDMSANFSFRRFFRKPPSSGPSFHLHLVTTDAWPTKSERLFRDWLLAHPAVAASYAALKAQLAIRFADDRDAYTEAKSDFIQSAVNDARHSRVLPPLTNWEE